MPLTPDLITRPGPFAVPYTYDLGATEVLAARSVFAHFDGSGASGSFLPCVSYYSATGVLLARTFPATALSAGATADVSWFPHVGAAAGVGAWNYLTPVAPASVPAGGVPGPAFQNNWLNAQLPDGTYSPLRYRLTPTGIQLIGAIDGGSLGTTVGVLPVGYRPPDDVVGSILSIDGSVALGVTVNAASGAITVTAPGEGLLPASGVTAGTYGDGSHVGQVTVNAQGLVTAAASVSISAASPLTTKGDLFTHSTVDTRLPVGADGTLLVADSGQTTGIKWATGVPGAISQSYIGYNTIGGSFETPGAGTITWYLKSVTLAQAALLTSIDLYVKGDGAHVGLKGVAVLDDNSGAPGKVIAVNAAETSSAIVDVEAFINTTARWVAKPLGVWLPAGTYWLGVCHGASNSLAFDGSGGDFKGSSSTWATDASLTSYTNSSNKYSIRGNIIQ